MLAVWIARGLALSLPRAVWPRLVVVTSIPGDAFNSKALRFRLRVLSDPKFLELYSLLNIVNLLGTGRKPSYEQFSGLIRVL
jgi:hypothetical protein